MGWGEFQREARAPTSTGLLLSESSKERKLPSLMYGSAAAPACIWWDCCACVELVSGGLPPGTTSASASGSNGTIRKCVLSRVFSIAARAISDREIAFLHGALTFCFT